MTPGGSQGSLGFVMLVHADLWRAADVARHWAERSCPIVIHVDETTPAEEFDQLRGALADLENVVFSNRYDCRWGHWSMVAATQDASELMLERFPDVQHVALVSGSCIPLRPVEDLISYLKARPGADFIESVAVEDVPWTIGGLQQERFTLWFPFSWKRHRRLFDRFVEVQRKLKISRRVPKGIKPHLGSQWWCLSRQTLRSILNDPRRDEFDRYFRRTWIPDEAYFQTLARRVSQTIESWAITLSKFDPQGKPFVFYDDHLQLLRRSDCFMARKIWPHADKLYDAFLHGGTLERSALEPMPQKIDRILTAAVERRHVGRPGLFMQSRFPSDTWDSGKTAAPYSVFQGFSEVFDDFEPWLARRTGARVHGHLFDWHKVEFAGRASIVNGGLSDKPQLRDYDPTGFLTSLIWNTRGERQCFQMAPYDRQEINEYIVYDPNAQISVITGAWALKLFKSQMPFEDVRREAAWMQRVEDHFVGQLRARGLPSRIRLWTFAEFMDDPMEHLQAIVDEIEANAPRRLTAAPKMADISGFAEFLQLLKNAGMKPYLTGDFAAKAHSQQSEPAQTRPYLVK